MANIEWYRKAAKKALVLLRAKDVAAKLADAQLAVARAAGFKSWRDLRAKVEAGSAAVVSGAPADGFLRLVHSGNVAVVRAVLEAEPGLANQAGAHPVWGGRPQPLHVAIEHGDRAMFDLLMELGADPAGDNSEYDGWSPLMLAIHWNREEMRAELLRRLETPTLVEWLMVGDDARVLGVLEAGSQALAGAAPNGGTLLHFARTVPAAKRLLELGVPVGAVDKYGQTPLDAAAAAGRTEVARLLVARGAEASPATWAKLGDVEALQRALQGSAPEAQLLTSAVKARQVPVARWLLAQGVDPNTRDAKGSKGTALHAAAWNGDLEMVELLLAGGADVGAVDEEHGTTPLVWARTGREITGNPACDAVVERLAQPFFES